MSLLRKILIWMSTGFGLGNSPAVPGTVGCILGVPIAWAANTWLGIPGQVILAVVLSLIAIPICDAGEKAVGKKDPHCVVADEYLTFSISLIGLPFMPWLVVFAFVSNRVFDILKLPPARKLQELPGGLGIVIDDVFAALYSLVANHIVYALVCRYWLSA